jgi:uridylate kinase
MPDKLYVISLGGSVLVPDKVDVKFLKEFKDLIIKLTKKGNSFIIICGGGKVCRDYQDAARQVSELSDEELDWIGVHATRFNAQLLHATFGKLAHKEVIKDPTLDTNFREQIVIAAGWKPGWSTDFVATILAKNHKVSSIVNVTSKPFVYDKDPAKFKDAKPIKKIEWSEFRKMFGSKWSPGLSSPFDPVASKECHDSNIKVVIMGSNLSNIKNFFENKKFEGTVIS